MSTRTRPIVAAFALFLATSAAAQEPPAEAPEAAPAEAPVAPPDAPEGKVDRRARDQPVNVFEPQSKDPQQLTTGTSPGHGNPGTPAVNEVGRSPFDPAYEAPRPRPGNTLLASVVVLLLGLVGFVIWRGSKPTPPQERTTDSHAPPSTRV